MSVISSPLARRLFWNNNGTFIRDFFANRCVLVVHRFQFVHHLAHGGKMINTLIYGVLRGAG
jgi:hypothetical protein